VEPVLTALGVPADPDFLLNGWAVVVFLALVMVIGVPLAVVKMWIVPGPIYEAEQRRGDTLQQAVNNGLEANLKATDAVLKMLPLAETTVAILEGMQDERDEARERGWVPASAQGDQEQPTSERARR
jgi:hypothetical protein